MNGLSVMARMYLMFGLITSGCFCAAAIGGWASPDFGRGTGGSSFMGGSGYHGGSSYGRSSGGSWGGGK